MSPLLVLPKPNFSANGLIKLTRFERSDIDKAYAARDYADGSLVAVVFNLEKQGKLKLQKKSTWKWCVDEKGDIVYNRSTEYPQSMDTNFEFVDMLNNAAKQGHWHSTGEKAKALRSVSSHEPGAVLLRRISTRRITLDLKISRFIRSMSNG